MNTRRYIVSCCRSLSVREDNSESAIARRVLCLRRRPPRGGDGVLGAERDRRKVIGPRPAGVKERDLTRESGAPLLTDGGSNPGGTSSSSVSWCNHPSYASATRPHQACSCSAICSRGDGASTSPLTPPSTYYGAYSSSSTLHPSNQLPGTLENSNTPLLSCRPWWLSGDSAGS